MEKEEYTALELRVAANLGKEPAEARAILKARLKAKKEAEAAAADLDFTKPPADQKEKPP